MTTPHEPTPDQVAARRAQLVEALRSGRYVQDREALRTSVGYCCLGVAEDVRGATWVDVNAEFADEPGHGPAWCVRLPPPDDPGDPGDPTEEYSVLTPAARRWYGLLANDPYVAWFDQDRGTYEVSSMTVLNDDVGLTLAQVGDVLADQPSDWDGTQVFALRDADRRNYPEEDE